MFGGEHTETTQEVKFCNDQPQHTLGPKNTARLHATDIRFAKIGKDCQRQQQPKYRRAQRQRAAEEGVAASMSAQTEHLWQMMTLMHAATVKDNAENQGVLKAFRQSGHLPHLPTAKGLKKVGPLWNAFKHGSEHFSAELLSRRTAHVVDGVPAKPDWTRLNRLRDKLHGEAAER